MKILVVDDELDICEILQYNLETEGYEVAAVNSAEEALDVMMENMSGFQMAHKMKENPATAQIPIIFITALDGENHMVKGLNIGADDYIVKPLSMKTVKARVNAVLRRVYPHGMRDGMSETDTVCYEGIVLDLKAKTVSLDHQDLPCTKLEFELLSFLLQHPGTVYSREDLLKYCWPMDTCVLDRTVDVNITRLRKKLGPYGKQIKTRVGYGYCFEK